ncbi:MAG: DUF3786 domain-containing protein [Lachnospiraceae bacterium]|nr:DUF3786 domain-containing protein [Lachnospiraceae bacterium]
MIKDDENRAFLNMKRDAIEMLAGKNPAGIAQDAGVTYDAGSNCFRLSSLGKMYTLTYPDYALLEETDQWHYLTMLHYMNLADGMELSGELCALGDMPDGLVRGANFDRTASAAIEKFAAGHSETEIGNILREMGGEIISGKADLSVRVPYLPRVPLTINIWFADEEFPPSARLLADRSIGHYLTIEDAVTVGDYLLRRLTEA